MNKSLVLLLALAWFTLPLLPALLELRRRREGAGLLIDRHHAGRPTYFATALLREVEQCAAVSAAQARPDGGPPAPAAPVELQTSQGRVLYCAASCSLKVDASVPVVLAAQRLELQPGSRLRHWAHAGHVAVRGGCSLGQRLTAHLRIDLEAPAEFRRLHAPSLVFGGPPVRMAELPRPSRPLDVAALPNIVYRQWDIGRLVLRGDLVLPPGTRVDASLVVMGNVTLGEGCVVVGSIKAHGCVELGANVLVQGALVARKGVRAGPLSRLSGPVMGEQWVELEQGVMVGGPNALTTVSTQRLRVHEGVVICGTAWARLHGQLLSPGSPPASSSSASSSA